MNSLEENDIRPTKLMEGQQEALKADVDYLTAMKDSFVGVGCPACGEAGKDHWEKRGFTYQQCQSCLTVFMNPRPTEEILHDFYRKSKNYAYWNRYIFPASEAARRQNIFVPRVNRLEEILDRMNIQSGALLEIGAGFGTFCEEVQSRGKFDRVVALEMTPDLAQTCRNRGLEVIDSPIESHDGVESTFDVIVAYEVLEHIFNPGRFISSIMQYMKTTGLLVLSCPNVEGFDVMTLGTISDVIDHEHLNYFNTRSIKQLLEAEGLTVHEVSTPGRLDADIVRNRALKGEIDLSDVRFLQHILVDHWSQYGDDFQNYLAKVGLSSHMLAVAQKL